MAQHTAPNVAMGGAGLGKTIYNLRWYICGLLFLVTLTNYVDRVTLGVLNPELKKVIGWNSSQFGWINFSFSLGYAVMFGIAGRLLDRFGVKAGMICAVVVWSLASTPANSPCSERRLGGEIRWQCQQVRYHNRRQMMAGRS